MWLFRYQCSVVKREVMGDDCLDTLSLRIRVIIRKGIPLKPSCQVMLPPASIITRAKANQHI